MNWKAAGTQSEHLKPDELAALHDELYPVVYRYVRYRLMDDQTAEDITAEVFLRLVDALWRRKRDVHDARAWLFGTAAHLISDHLRSKYRHTSVQLDDQMDLPNAQTTEAAAEDNLRKQQVKLALQQLTEEQQHVLALRFSQEQTIEETARLMQKSINAVKVLQFRAVASLRRLLDTGEEWNEADGTRPAIE